MHHFGSVKRMPSSLASVLFPLLRWGLIFLHICSLSHKNSVFLLKEQTCCSEERGQSVTEVCCPSENLLILIFESTTNLPRFSFYASAKYQVLWFSVASMVFVITPPSLGHICKHCGESHIWTKGPHRGEPERRQNGLMYISLNLLR